MMVLDKVFSRLAVAVVCSLLLAAGCAPPAEEIAKPEVEIEKQIPKAAAPETGAFALKFTPQDTTTYKVIIETQDSIKFAGPFSKSDELKDKTNRRKTEMLFTQQIQSVDDNGNAVAKITIKGLKYSLLYQNNPALNYSSYRPKDRRNPLQKLIGSSYTIEIAPTGEVIKVIDATEARAAAKGSSLEHVKASELLESDAIRQRHGIVTLPVAKKSQLASGDSWSSTKNFSFRMMGSKSYERIYTVKETTEQAGRRIAVAEMKAIPSSEMAEQLHKKDTASSFVEMFDNVEAYTGELVFDITASKLEKYSEKLRSEWVVIDPAAETKPDREPDTITMEAIRVCSIERID